MAVYTNDLRLKEIATGDESGTWGTSTNTNLSLIADAFSFGTEAITTNADTHTTTIADGAADPGRSIFLKYTGTLDSACTITIGPNTVSKLWLIENATSGSQNIIIKQGSGATVTIANGQTKAIYSDGAGSGGAMVDAFQDLSIPDLFIDDDLTFSSDSAVITFGADGDTTLTHTDGSGLTLNSTNKLMFNDASQFIQGSSATVLSLGATDEIDLTATAIDVNGTMDVSGAITSSAGATITVSDNSDVLTLVSTDADDAFGPFLNLHRNSSSPADNDGTGVITFAGENDNNEEIDYAQIQTAATDVSDGTEDGTFIIQTMVAGTSRDRITISPSETSLNENSVDVDFRVESNGDANAFFVDAGNDKIGVLTNAPSGQFHVYNGMLQVGSKTGDTSIQQNANAIRIAAVPNSSTEWGGLQWYREFSDVIGCEIIAARASSTETDSDLIFKTSTNSSNAVEAMRIDHSGLVGIGNSSPSSFNALADNLVVGTTSGSNGISIVAATDGNSSIYFADGTSGSGQQLPGFIQYGHSSNALLLGAATIEHIKLDGSVVINEGSEDMDVRIEGNNNSNLLVIDGGNDVVNIGGTTVEDGDALSIHGSGTNTVARMYNTNTGADGCIFIFQKASSSPADSDVLGDIRFHGNDDGGTMTQFAQIKAHAIDVTNGTEDGQIAFNALLNGTNRERLKLNSTEAVFNEESQDLDFRVESGSKTHMLFVDGANNFIGIANNNRVFSSTELFSVDGNAPGIGIKTSTAAEQAIGIVQSAGASTNFMLRFDNGSGAVGSITHNGSTTAYNTSSDERIKENIQDAEDAGELIDSIQVRQFDWKIGGKHQRYGMIAQELNLVAPEACAMGDGDKDIAAVDYSILVPMLVKEIQTLRTRIEKLEGE